LKRFVIILLLLVSVVGVGSNSRVNPAFVQPAAAQSGPASIANAIVTSQATSLSLNPGAQLYIYGFVTGGGSTTGNFANGPYASVTNAGGYLVAALAATSNNVNSFTTQTSNYDIGGAAVSGFSQYVASYGTNSTSGALGASDTFTVVSSASLVVVVGLGGDEQCISISGLPGLTIDATDKGATGLPSVIMIANTYLNLGTYTATEQTQQCATGQDPAHAADLIGVFVFTSGVSNTGTSSLPASTLLVTTTSSATLSSTSSAITTTVGATGSLQVFVHDAQGNPVSGAWVVAYGAPIASLPITYFLGSSDSTGQYTFQNLPAGFYVVEAIGNGGNGYCIVAANDVSIAPGQAGTVSLVPILQMQYPSSAGCTPSAVIPGFKSVTTSSSSVSALTSTISLSTTSTVLSGSTSSTTSSPTSFTLNVFNNTGSYSVQFFVDTNMYESLQDKYTKYYGAESAYLYYSIVDPNDYPIYSVKVTQGGQLLAAAAGSQVCFQTLVWGYDYFNAASLIDTLSSGQQSLSPDINIEWWQKVGIALANAENFLSGGVLLDLLQNIYGGADGSNAQNLLKLVNTVSQGYNAIRGSEYASRSDQIYTVLQKYGFVTSRDYTALDLLYRIDTSNLGSQAYMNFIRDLYFAAYGTTVDSTIQSLGYSLLKQLGQYVVQAGQEATFAAICTFAEVYFAQQLTLQTSAAITATMFTTEFSSAFVGAALLLFAASLITQYSLMEANLIAQQIQIENILYYSIYPEAENSLSNLISNQRANVTAGVSLSYATGFIDAADSAWNQLEYTIVSNELFVSCGGDLTTEFQNCQSSDAQNAQQLSSTYASFAYDIYQALNQIQSSANAELANQDPAAINLTNELAKPLFQSPFASYRTNNVVGLTLNITNAELGISLLNNSLSYPYFFFLSNGVNKTVVLLLGSPSGTYGISASRPALVKAYSVNSTSVTLDLMKTTTPDQAQSIRVVATEANFTEITSGSASMAISQSGLPAGASWGFSINGNSLHLVSPSTSTSSTSAMASSSASSPQSTTVPTSPAPGFPIESILVGLLGGLLALTIIRRRRNRSEWRHAHIDLD
jgi:hypothetical protein